MKIFLLARRRRHLEIKAFFVGLRAPLSPVRNGNSANCRAFSSELF
jgi:hypothetical protein